MKKLALAAIVVAAQLALSAQVRQTPTFRASTETVVIDAVVTDGEGRAIADLAPNEFSVFRDGRPQELVDVRFVYQPTLHRPFNFQSPPPPVDVVTNVPSDDGRLFVIVFDDLHLLASELVRAKRALQSFIEALGPDDAASLTFVGRSDLGVAPTRDRAQVAAGLDRLREAMGFGVSPIDEKTVTVAAPAGGGRVLTLDRGSRRRHARSVVATLRNVARGLESAQHSRRVLLYVSGGIVLTQEMLGDAYFQILTELEDVYEQYKRINVPIYAFDPRGVLTPESAVVSPAAIDNPRAAALARRNLNRQRDVLTEMAINTGGRAIVGRNDVAGAVVDVIRDNSSYYILSFDPRPLLQDGRYHAIQVKVSRKGAHVRARSRYFADRPTDRPETGRERLDQALGAGTPISGLTLRAAAAPVVVQANGTATFSIAMEIDHPKVASTRTGSGGDLLTAVAAIDQEGRVLEVRRAAQPLALPISKPLSLVRTITVPPAHASLRVGAWSAISGQVGAVHLPLTGPRPDQEYPSVAGVMFGRGLSSPIDQTGDFPFSPTASRSFAKEDRIEVAVSVYRGRVPLSGAPVLRVVRGNTEAVRFRLNQLAESARLEVYSGTLPVAALPRGAYSVFVDLPGERSAQSRPFHAIFSVR